MPDVYPPDCHDAAKARAMLMYKKLRRLIQHLVLKVRWYTIVAAFSLYAGSAWLLLWLAGEGDMLAPVEFVYWLIVTSSTVGYGDLSPSTDAGKWLVSLYVIPVGLTIFAMVLGRGATLISNHWLKSVKGLKATTMQDHILVIGWNGQRTLQLLSILQKERAQLTDKPDILLCVKADIDNPMLDDVGFVKVASFNNDEEMDRANVAEASVIIIDNADDDMSMTTALYCSSRNPEGHLVAYFTDDNLAKLLQSHCPNVECMPSVSVEMLAKSAFDPGSGSLFHDLISAEDGQAQYSVALPESMNAGDLFTGLKRQYDATLIGFSLADGSAIQLNPRLDMCLDAGCKIYYIATSRINAIDWATITDSAKRI